MQQAMDREQEELQFLGFFDIWRESLKIICRWRDIFLRLSLTLILPLSFFYLAHTEISHLLSHHVALDKITLAYTKYYDTTSYNTALRTLARDQLEYTIIQLAFLISILVFSLLSTSAIVYTVACIYSGKNVTFKGVMSVVPKVWKRLMVTLLCIVALLFIYNFALTFIIMAIIICFPFNPNDIGKYVVLGLIFLILILYLVGFCYMSVIWQLANVVSVLEDSYGFQALRRSKTLIKGKMGISISIFLVYSVFLGGAWQLYKSFVVNVDQSNVGMFSRVGFGLISLLFLCIFLLLGLVAHTVLYLVCKSYHHERIDKSALSEHLEVYHGEGYVILKSKNMQMEQV